MLNILLVTAFFVAYLLILKKQRGGWLFPSIFLVFIYLFSLVCLIVSISRGTASEILQQRYLLPTIFFILLILLFFVPFTSFREDQIKQIVLPSKQTLDIISSILIVLSFESIFFFAEGVYSVFSYGDLGAARNDRYTSGVSFVQHSLWYTISSVSASLYMFDILFYFIYGIIGGKNKLRRILLFIGSFSETMHVLTEAGRDGIVFWIFAFVFIYLIIRPFMEQSQRKGIVRSFVIVATLLLIPFAMISVGRFQDNASNSYFDYMGQPFKHFCYYFDFDPLPVSYGQSFPLYFELTGQPMPLHQEYANGLTSSTSFGTFLRGFLTNFGIIGTLIVGVFMAFIFIAEMRKTRRNMYFNQFFVYILYFQIYAQGVFYFRQYTRGGNLFILMCLVFTVVFKFRINDISTPLVITRIEN